MSHLSPEEVERIKEEQRIRSVEGVKSVTKHLFKLYLKILGIFLAIIFGLGIIAVIIATVLGGIGRLKTQNSLRQFSVTQTVIAELAVATSQSFTSTDPAIQTQESTNLNQSSSTPSMGAPGQSSTPAVTTTPLPTMTATQIPSGPWAYKVQDQESPICLARRFNVDPDVLFALNILDINSVVQAGQEILIPAPGTPWSDKYGSRVLAAHPTTYVVQPNDTIYSIACYFGDVSPEIIAYTNGLEPPYTLTSGQILNIP